MKRLLTSAAMFLCCVATSFAQFSGSGSGTENDPYLILNPIQLNQMRNFLNKSNVYFKMMADIDLTEFIEDEYGSKGWLPMGTSSQPFRGILDGNGKTITGLRIDRSNTDNVGLIGIAGGSEIKNLVLRNVVINGNKNVGALIGSGNSTIEGCTIYGIIKGNENVGGCAGDGGHMLINILSYADIYGGNNTGGVIGKSDSSISNCRVYSNILGYDMTGGICGCLLSNYEKISSCTFIGGLSGNKYVGGISGVKRNYGNVEKCFVAAQIVGKGDYVGGISGYCYGETITNSYFSGNISGNNEVGGIIGRAEDSGSIIACYSCSSITGNDNVGGISGSAEGYSSGFSYSYVYLKTCVSNSSYIKAKGTNVGRICGNIGFDVGIYELGTSNENKALNRCIVVKSGVAEEINDDKQNGTGVSPTTLKLKATYVAMGWDFTDTWEIQETECYPYFKTQTAPPVIQSQVVSGATTISGKCVSGATVTLDIDGVKQEKVFGGTTFTFNVDPLQAGHEIRVSAKADGKEQSYFTTEVVSFLGKGTESDPYQISTAADLTQVYRKGYYKLMNDIDLTSYINQYYSTEGWESIGRDGSETVYFDGNNHKVTGLWCNSTRDNTGLFSCFANGYIKNLTVETASGKQVKGGANTGILIGKLINGTIDNCKVSGSVADGTPVGGIVGLLDGGQILLSQANVTIKTTGDDTYVGGLVGEITSGEIDQCVTLGSVTATGTNSQAGGLVGKNAATVTNCYSNASVTSAYCAAGLIAYNYGLVEKCYATGNLSSQNYGAGVIGYNDGANAIIRNCAAMNQKIDVTYESQSAQSGGYGQRILGGYKNGAPDPEMNNYALKTMQLSVNDLPQKVYNDIMNGTAKKGSDLMVAATYQELNWDFTDKWTITAGETYPFLKNNVAEVKKYVKVAPIVIAPTALPNLIYNGEAQNLVTSGVTTSGYIYYSLDGTNYSRTIPTGINANSYVVYYKVIDDEDSSESNQGSTSVTISAKLLDNPTVTLSETSYIYDGTAKKPTVTVEDGETTVPTTDYTLSYSNNTKVGTATVTIMTQTGKNYKFPSTGVTADFQILREMAGLFAESDFWASYVAQEDLALPSELTAYVITSFGTTSATATSLNYIPEGVPVILKRSSSTVKTFLASAGTGTAPTTNLLKSYTSDKNVSDQEGYILYKDKFVLVKEGTLPAGKVFLPANGSGNSFTRSIIIDGEDTTGIDNWGLDSNESLEGWYNIQGRRLDKKPTKKGLYILNGRKVIVK